MKRRRHRIALIERLLDGASGFVQFSVVDSDADQALRTIFQTTFEDGLEQLLRLPLAARVEEILRAPTTVLTAVGPDDAGEAAPPQADQRSQCLAHATDKGALLWEHVTPVGGNSKKLR